MLHCTYLQITNYTIYCGWNQPVLLIALSLSVGESPCVCVTSTVSGKKKLKFNFMVYKFTLPKRSRIMHVGTL